MERRHDLAAPVRHPEEYVVAVVLHGDDVHAVAVAAWREVDHSRSRSHVVLPAPADEGGRALALAVQ